MGRRERGEILAIDQLMEQVVGRKWDVPHCAGAKRDWRGGVGRIPNH